MDKNTPSPAPYDPALEPLVQLAKEDLATRLSLAADTITVLEARAVVWPDSSLGCPQPGMSYLQVPEDGALVRLSAAGKVYEYHSGGSRGLFLCEQTTLSAKQTPVFLDTLVPPPGDDDY
jgi:hypothetical protein